MKAPAATCDLSSCFLCRLCLRDWLPAVEVHKRNVWLKKGQQLVKEGDAVTGIYFVYEGTLKVHKKWDEEKELITRFCRQGDILGHLGLGDKPLYPVSVTALEPSLICYLEMDFFETTLRVNAGLSYKLVRFLANELQETQRSMRDLAHMPVKARIAQCFLRLKNQFGTRSDGTVNIGISRQDIASFAGTSYETLFKVINEFTDSNIIKMTGRNIRILNEELLASMIGPGRAVTG
jgi:CRP/FNR family transcriptional regulator